MSGFTISRVTTLEGRLAPFHWDWADREQAWIEARWASLLAARPKMFDGRVLMAHRWALDGDTFRAAYFETRFSRFLSWREAGRPEGVANCFSMAALRAPDGAFVLGEMGAHTANAGKIYFPAGTPDPDDLVGDVVDLAGSALRELGEETGLGAHDVTAAPEWTIVAGGGMIACMKPMLLAMSAEAAVERIHATLERQTDRELARMHIARRRSDLDPARIPPFLAAYLDHELPA